MSVTNVSCTTNNLIINVSGAENTDGKLYQFNIEKNKALIDANGLIRFFVLDWGDGDVEGYLVHPYKEYTLDPNLSWTLNFLANFGLKRIQNQLIKVPKGTNPLLREAINLASHFTFSTGGGYLVSSFLDAKFSKNQLGYHNIRTDKFVWKKPFFVEKW